MLNCQRRSDKKLLLCCFKKKGTGTFDAATRTALHFSRADQGYLSYNFHLKTFKNKKDFKIRIVRQILTHFFKKNMVTFLDKGGIVNFHTIDLFTPALSDCQNALPIFCEVFNAVENFENFVHSQRV